MSRTIITTGAAVLVAVALIATGCSSSKSTDVDHLADDVGAGAPVCTGFTVQVPENAPTVVPLAKANCTNGPITDYGTGDGPSHGGWDLGPRTKGRFVYLPTIGYVGQDAATFVATNGAGQTSAPFTVTLDVYDPPAPVCSDLTVKVPENGDVVLGLDDLQCTNGPVAFLNGPFVVPKHGGGFPAGSGWEYQPNHGFVGQDQGTFVAEDSAENTSQPFTVTFLVEANTASR